MHADITHIVRNAIYNIYICLTFTCGIYTVVNDTMLYFKILYLKSKLRDAYMAVQFHNIIYILYIYRCAK